MTPWTATHQTSLSLTSLLEFAQVHAHWSGDAIQSSHPLSCCTPPALNFFPASRSFPMSWLFASCGQSIGASVSAPVLLKSIQGWFPLRLTGLSPCFPRDSPKSYPTTQFKSINSLAFSLLHCPTLTSIRDYWKEHTFDYIQDTSHLSDTWSETIFSHSVDCLPF